MIATNVVADVEVWVVGTIVAASLAYTLLWALKHPVRWLWRTNVSEPIGRWGRRELGIEIDTHLAPIITRVDALSEAIGPKNGRTIGEKVSTLTTVQAQILSMIGTTATDTATAVEDVVHAEHEQTRAGQLPSTVVQITQTTEAS